MCTMQSQILLFEFVKKLHIYCDISSHILSSETIGSKKICVRSRKNHMTSKISRTRTYFYHPITITNKLIVMFYDDNGISHRLERFDRSDHFGNFTIIKSNRRFIQDIDNPRKFVSELFGKSQPLYLTARQTINTSIEIEIP